MITKSDPAMAGAGPARPDDSPGNDQPGSGIPARRRREVTLPKLACESISADTIRSAIAGAIGDHQVASLERVVFPTIGRDPAESRSNSQALVDRFVLRRRALEAWASEAGLRVSAGYLRPAGELFTAIFDLEPTGGTPARVRVNPAADPAGGTSTPPKDPWRRR